MLWTLWVSQLRVGTFMHDKPTNHIFCAMAVLETKPVACPHRERKGNRYTAATWAISLTNICIYIKHHSDDSAVIRRLPVVLIK